MAEVYNKSLSKLTSIHRVLGHIKGINKGATTVFFAGIHGNETAGVFALKGLFKTMTPKMVSGSVYGISGNLKALEQNQRYIDKDLNRLWTKKQLESLEFKEDLNAEDDEQLELYLLIKHIISANSGPF
jgi:succinylglutamate desuccinylase